METSPTDITTSEVKPAPTDNFQRSCSKLELGPFRRSPESGRWREVPHLSALSPSCCGSPIQQEAVQERAQTKPGCVMFPTEPQFPHLQVKEMSPVFGKTVAGSRG